MKKQIAYLLAAALFFNMGSVAYAAQPDTSGQTVEESGNLPEQDSVSQSDAATLPSGQDVLPSDNQKVEDVGLVTVSIGAALELKQPVTFTVTLSDAQGGSRADSVVIGGSQAAGSRPAQESRVRFGKLAPGEYTLAVSAQGFAAYTQTISVRNKAYAVNLMTGFPVLDGVVYQADTPHPGVLLVGDVNGDGKIDLSDRTKLMAAIDGETYSAQCDLNGDGVVDLVDLEYFTIGYNETRHTLAREEVSISPLAITGGATQGTVIASGSLADALGGVGSVTLKPAADGEITEDNPLTLEFDFHGTSDMNQMDGFILETAGDNHIRKGKLLITYEEDGNLQGPVEIPVPEEGIYPLLRGNEGVTIERHNGAIWINLGSQIAVKKITFIITGMMANPTLAEISKVEFVNGMGDRIPDPEMDIPENLNAVASSKKVSLSWDTCVNVTGYEVLVKRGDRQETVMVNKNAFDLTSFGGRELENYQEYRIQVQSVNGTWRSGYGPEVSATPKPNGKPDKPDNVSARGKYQSIVVSWKNMKDTLTYTLYYKESTAAEYQKIPDIQGNSYTLQGLKDLTEYTLYVTGVNEFGESSPSITVSAKTTDMNPAVVPRYNLINTGGKGEAGNHIVKAAANGKMYDSPLDTKSGTAWGTVDHDPASYYYKGSWDDGGYNAMGLQHGLTYEFDQVYKMDTIALQEIETQDMAYSYAKVRYWDASGAQVDLGNVSIQQRSDKEGRIYYVLKLPQAVELKKIQFGLARYLATGNVPITVSEVYFYHYDTLMDEIMALYADDLHTTLRADVTQSHIDALRVKVNTVDPVSGEYHPDRELLEQELATAEAILKDARLGASVTIHNTISTKDAGRGFSGLNAWQPLGVTVAAQEEIMVYVGHNTRKTGDATNLQLVATQYHAESGSVSREIASLKVGANKITVPKLWSASEYESGGALYVQYTGDNPDDRYAVRVSGGVQVPKLDLYQVTDPAQRLILAQDYLKELQAYVDKMEAQHGEVHQGGKNSQVNLAYDEQNCILGASDILLDTMMLSLPAKQILAGTGSGSLQEKADRLVGSMDAMEGMMYLFYQHKGLNRNATDEVDRIPGRHLNIRYQRMFSGAFMYAAGNHIGIEWGSATGMVGASPVQADSEGRYESGAYFGWGIAHEIGHCINQGAYAIAEVTNNYFAVLAQAKDTNDSVRFQYDKVYQKVASGTKGAASNVFTRLGMYWQLHLAYDKGYNFKTYEDYQTQLDNLFFARVDTYARTPAKAPAPGGVTLVLEGDTDQKLMRLSCAAAGKNILEFFERWGMTPDEGTRAYAAQFGAETRAICYVNDEARVYSLTGTGSRLGTAGNVEAVGDGVCSVANTEVANQVDITLASKNMIQEDILGYEIVRCTISGGQTQKEAVGFVARPEGTFSDTLPINNRVVWYEVTLIDKYLNRSAVKSLEPLKVEHDGSLDKSMWTASVQGMIVQGQDATANGTEESPCEPPREDPAGMLIDNNVGTIFKANAMENAAFTIEFNRTLTISGFKYTLGETVPGGSYEIQVRTGEGWVTAAEGQFGQEAGRTSTIYFENGKKDYVSTYAASAVKFILTQKGLKPVAMAELDVLGVTGDNVDFARTAEDRAVAIGKLGSDYTYSQDGQNHVIPAGSIVFTGTYKGNPAYNVVVLYDQNGNIVGGTDGEGNLKAQQIILADVAAEGLVQNVYNGTWIYWIEPGQQASLKNSSVRAELYRVNDALTNEGQRLVSDSLSVEVPGTLPVINIGN